MTVMDATAAPERSLEQRMHALAAGNRVRKYRATFKKDLKAGRVSVQEVRDMLGGPAPHPLLESMKVRALLVAVPKVGGVKADKMLRSAAVSPSKTLLGLTWRQREALSEALLPYDTRRGGRFSR